MFVGNAHMLEPIAWESSIVPSAKRAADQRGAAAAGGLTDADRVRSSLFRRRHGPIHLRPGALHQLRAHTHRYMRNVTPTQAQAVMVRGKNVPEVFLAEQIKKQDRRGLNYRNCQHLLWSRVFLQNFQT